MVELDGTNYSTVDCFWTENFVSLKQYNVVATATIK